jgi:hypothetical protein
VIPWARPSRPRPGFRPRLEPHDSIRAARRVSPVLPSRNFTPRSSHPFVPWSWKATARTSESWFRSSMRKKMPVFHSNQYGSADPAEAFLEFAGCIFWQSNDSGCRSVFHPRRLRAQLPSQ